MVKQMVLILMVVLVGISWPTDVQALDLVTQRGPFELCETEVFKPNCNKGNEVVMVTKAVYGRMALGRCVKTDYGYVGCNRTVLDHMDEICSGKRKCEVAIPDPTLDETQPCPSEFKTYLNISYQCIRVETEACRSCSKTMYARLNNTEGYISSAVTAEDKLNCGTSSCPWVIRVKPGQKINLTLYDFDVASYSGGCSQYALIKEMEPLGKDTQVCSGRQKVRHVYDSLSNSLEINFRTSERGHFLLHYKAVGCPDLSPPANTLVRRKDDKMEVICEPLNAEWKLQCVGTQWDGEMGACPEQIPTPQPQREVITLPLGILIAIVVGIALVIGVLILTIGIVCLKRQQHVPRQRMETAMYMRARQDPDSFEEAAREPPGDYKEVAARQLVVAQKPPVGAVGMPPGMQRENVYLRRMDSRPLPSLPNIAESVQSNSDDDPDKAKIQVYRTNSGREHCHKAKVVTRTGPPPRDDPQYFVLDAEEEAAKAAAVEAAAAAAAAEQRRRAREANMAADQKHVRQKTPEEENAENFNKEVNLNNSCHEIPLRPTREGSQQSHSENNYSGNSSWP